ncbi:actin-related protein 8-like [Saccostrea cucullata]|uniref:actin-related protein 8-like n=1 Tax=Saccostrea cuccullata TaxID=36930 RepID=UPI002ECFBDC2
MPSNATKRLYIQNPEPITEPVQTSTIVIIHPGSLNLRIGRASDPLPVTIPQCIARKRISQTRTSSSLILRPECVHSEAKPQFKVGLKQAEEAVGARPMSTGEYRQTPSVKQLYNHNHGVKGQRTEVTCQQMWTRTESQPPFIVGQEAMYVNPADNYNLHWPMRRGRLNIHDRPGGTLTAVLADIEVIWATALQKHLDIPLKDLKMYKAMLLIPDVFSHRHTKHLMTLLLDRLGFGSAILHQESVCATFGSGVSSACVVDIGDQKTSVCCVEDGISHRNTRVTMDYGGSDITRCFHHMIQRSGINLRELDAQNTVDCLLLQEMKETYCTLDQDDSGVKEHSILIKKPEQHIVKYPIRLGEEVILTPMSLFFPDLLTLHGDLAHVQKRSEGDPEDPHDEFYLKMTTRETKLAKKKDNSDNKDANESNIGQFDDSTFQPQIDEDSNDNAESLQVTDIQKGGRGLEMEEELEAESDPVVQLMGVDQAILHSIDKCDNDETKKKMYSCMVVVGGGMMFEGAQQWLQYRVWVGMPPQYRLMLETMDVFTRPKDMDPCMVCWKGAAILACLDTTQELWITQREWRQYSVRMLRERAPFMW